MNENGPGTFCNEVHPLPTRKGEIILVGQLTFAAADIKPLIPAIPQAQVFEIDLQPDTAGTYQLFEGATAVSGLWTLAASQFFTWGGKYTIGGVNFALRTGQGCVVQFEARYRPF